MNTRTSKTCVTNNTEKNADKIRVDARKNCPHCLPESRLDNVRVLKQILNLWNSDPENLVNSEDRWPESLGRAETLSALSTRI